MSPPVCLPNQQLFSTSEVRNIESVDAQSCNNVVASLGPSNPAGRINFKTWLPRRVATKTRPRQLLYHNIRLKIRLQRWDVDWIFDRICAFWYGWWVTIDILLSKTHWRYNLSRIADWLRESLHRSNKYILDFWVCQDTWPYSLADNILARYGKEMTWDIKAGLMGKRMFMFMQPQLPSPVTHALL